MKKFQLVLVAIFLFTTTPLKSKPDTIIVPPIVAIAINNTSPGGFYYNNRLGTSIFNYQVSVNDLMNLGSGGHKYIINGALYTNCGANGDCNGNRITVDVIPQILTLTNGSNSVRVNLSGRVGNADLVNGRTNSLTFIKTYAVPIIPWQADLQIFGDIDQTTISPVTSPGNYTGTFTIQIALP